jgi:ADP-ribosyl-[dinitrogen reductase] hydrolase
VKIDDVMRRRAQGLMVGAAVGDALGMPLEFGHVQPPLKDMVKGRLPMGHFTDDTEMALALADSILIYGRLNPADVMARFSQWFSAGGQAGRHTGGVMRSYQRTGSWITSSRESRSRNPESAPNGSLMRVWPLAVAFWRDPDYLCKAAIMQSALTHPAEDCLSICSFAAEYMRRLLLGEDKWEARDNALTYVTNKAPEIWSQDAYDTVLNAHKWSFEQLNDSNPDTKGWVLSCIEVALWAFLNHSNFPYTVLQAANVESDHDTNACVAGAFAGAFYGINYIPQEWRQKVYGFWPYGTGSRIGAEQLIRRAERLLTAVDVSETNI